MITVAAVALRTLVQRPVASCQEGVWTSCVVLGSCACRGSWSCSRLDLLDHRISTQGLHTSLRSPPQARLQHSNAVGQAQQKQQEQCIQYQAQSY